MGDPVTFTIELTIHGKNQESCYGKMIRALYSGRTHYKKARVFPQIYQNGQRLVDFEDFVVDVLAVEKQYKVLQGGNKLELCGADDKPMKDGAPKLTKTPSQETIAEHHKLVKQLDKVKRQLAAINPTKIQNQLVKLKEQVQTIEGGLSRFTKTFPQAKKRRSRKKKNQSAS